MLILGQAGDTIVEVLVVLIVLGSALGIAYAIANHSLLETRQAQEHSEATELLQGQLEQLRASSANYPQVFDHTKYSDGFCFNSDVLVDLSSSPNGCTDGFYSYSIKHLAANDHTFSAAVNWPDVDGRTTDTVTLEYKLAPQS